MIQPYKVFNSAEFTNRVSDFEQINAILKEKNRGAVIFEGDRGSGKTTFLFELYRRLQSRSELRPFLINLFPYSAPEFEKQENLWLDTEKHFQKEDIPHTLKRLSGYLGTAVLESDDLSLQKDYLARALAYRDASTTPVLLVDSIYECAEDVRIDIEQHILAPMLASERVFLILSGRGKRPIWSRPELQQAKIITLSPLPTEFVRDQLEKLAKTGKLKRKASEYNEIAELSDGYPLLVRLMAASEPDETLPDALNKALDVLIKEVLPEGAQEEQRYNDIRIQIEKLSLVSIPFRIPDVEEYLYPAARTPRANTSALVNLLLSSYLLRFEGKGYQLNQSIAAPMRKWLARQKATKNYLRTLTEVSQKLQKEYPNAAKWYQRMLPMQASLG